MSDKSESVNERTHNTDQQKIKFHVLVAGSADELIRQLANSTCIAVNPLFPRESRQPETVIWQRLD